MTTFEESEVLQSINGFGHKTGIIWSMSMVLVVATSLVFILQHWVSLKKSKLPPGPPGWPIIGSLLELEPLVHRAFARLAKRYGPILYMRLGVWDTVVISSAKEAEDLFKNRDLEFASRPHSTVSRLAAKYIGFEGQDIVFQSYNANLKMLRKICSMELLQTTMNGFVKLRAEEVNRLVQTVSNIAEQGEPLELRDHFIDMTTNMMTELMFGRRYFGVDLPQDSDIQNFRNVMKDIVVAMSGSNIADLIPALEWLDPAGMLPQYKSIQTRLLKLFGRIVEEHKQEKAMLMKTRTEKKLKDFCDFLLDYEGDNKQKLSDATVMGVLVDMLGAGTDNSASSMEWTMAQLLRHPSVLHRLQQEIDRVVGSSRPVAEADLRNMPLLDAVVKEIFRLNTPVPLLLPRMNEKATTLSGYDIPKNSTLFINTWAIGRDPSLYENPADFDPDRFLRNPQVSMNGTCYELLPFGSGRRNCIGLKLGVIMVQFTLASLLHAFDWSPAPGQKEEDICVEEAFGFALRMAVPLVALPKTRAAAKLYKF